MSIENTWAEQASIDELEQLVAGRLERKEGDEVTLNWSETLDEDTELSLHGYMFSGGITSLYERLTYCAAITHRLRDYPPEESTITTGALAYNEAKPYVASAEMRVHSAQALAQSKSAHPVTAALLPVLNEAFAAVIAQDPDGHMLFPDFSTWLDARKAEATGDYNGKFRALYVGDKRLDVPLWDSLREHTGRAMGEAEITHSKSDTIYLTKASLMLNQYSIIPGYGGHSTPESSLRTRLNYSRDGTSTRFDIFQDDSVESYVPEEERSYHVQPWIVLKDTTEFDAVQDKKAVEEIENANQERAMGLRRPTAALVDELSQILRS